MDGEWEGRYGGWRTTWRGCNLEVDFGDSDGSWSCWRVERRGKTVASGAAPTENDAMGEAEAAAEDAAESALRE